MRVVQILGLVVQSATVVRGLTGYCNPQINPDTVDSATRSQWCYAQINTCGILCAGNTNTNTCDPLSLCYDCTCSFNSSSPGLQYYAQTMPTYQCEEVYSNCIVAGENDVAAQKQCGDVEKANCGHLNPDTFSPSSSSSSSFSALIRVSSSYISKSSTASGAGEQITSITKTITPTPTSTTTIWSTSTADAGSNGTSGNYSTLPGITVISSSQDISTLPGITDISTSSTAAAATAKPSTVSASGAERMRGGGIWGVVGIVGVVGVWGVLL